MLFSCLHSVLSRFLQLLLFHLQVTSILDRALRPAEPSSSDDVQPTPKSAQESVWRMRVAQLTAAAYALQAFPGRGGGLNVAGSLPQNKATPAKAAAVPDGSATATTKSIDGTSATVAPAETASAATGEEKFGWCDVNEYLKWYAAERYLTGGTANRKGPPWAARHHLPSSVGTNKAGTKNSNSIFSDGCQPLRLRAQACAGRVATLLWEHGDSLWRLLCRGDRFQGCAPLLFFPLPPLEVSLVF